MKDLVIKISSELKIPVWFKYLDFEKSHNSDISQNSNTTRFVVNFSSVEYARIFYTELTKYSQYQTIVPDRTVNYNWHRLDDKSTFASWFREERDALNRIKAATRNKDWTYSYIWENWKMLTISEEVYEWIINKYSSTKSAQELWEQKQS